MNGIIFLTDVLGLNFSGYSTFPNLVQMIAKYVLSVLKKTSSEM